MSKWKKGKSGNPMGRPKGKETHSTSVRRLLQAHSDELVQKVVELALSGDNAALKLCLERICPPLKPKEEPMSIFIAPENSLSQIGQAVINSVIEGDVPSQEASSFLSCLLKETKVIEFVDLDKRLEEIEKRVESMPSQSYGAPYAEEAECYPEDEPAK